MIRPSDRLCQAFPWLNRSRLFIHLSIITISVTTTFIWIPKTALTCWQQVGRWICFIALNECAHSTGPDPWSSLGFKKLQRIRVPFIGVGTFLKISSNRDLINSGMHLVATCRIFKFKLAFIRKIRVLCTFAIIRVSRKKKTYYIPRILVIEFAVTLRSKCPREFLASSQQPDLRPLRR
jgi:hypothetical protein